MGGKGRAAWRKPALVAGITPLPLLLARWRALAAPKRGAAVARGQRRGGCGHVGRPLYAAQRRAGGAGSAAEGAAPCEAVGRGGRRAAAGGVEKGQYAGGQATLARGAAGGRGRGEGRASPGAGGVAGRGGGASRTRREQLAEKSPGDQQSHTEKGRGKVPSVCGGGRWDRPGLAPRWLLVYSQAYKGGSESPVARRKVVTNTKTLLGSDFSHTSLRRLKLVWEKAALGAPRCVPRRRRVFGRILVGRGPQEERPV
jgi:hypothetical protein